jgi:hypothetical protein
VDGENQVWVPSLYMGLLPLALALAVFRLRRADPVRRWLSWMVLVAVVASFGRYGLGWLAALGWSDAGQYVGQPFGGLYWLLTVILPGYIEFRYPAKLLVVAALGLSVLAALGWDQVERAGGLRLRRALLGLAVISLLGILVFLALCPWWQSWLSGAEPDPLFGPLDAWGAACDVLGALVQTALIALAGWWLVKRAASGSRWAGPAVLTLIVIDLAVANGWLVPTALPDASRSALVAPDADATPHRVDRHATWVPSAWAESSSARRLAELARWNRQTAAPHHHLTQHVALVDVAGTMDLYDYQLLTSIFDRGGKTADRLLDLVGATKRIGPAGDHAPQNANAPLDARVTASPSHFPRTWIVHDVVRLPSIRESDATPMMRRTREVFETAGPVRDFHREAVVESDAEIAAGSQAPHGDETSRIVHYDPLRVEIEAVLSSPGLVVLADQFYPGWRLTVAPRGGIPQEMKALRTNRVMRGVWLPAGQYRLLFEYRPLSFVLGVVISGLGIALTGLLVAWSVGSLRGGAWRRVARLQ